jgi:hypothetical protein
VVIATPVTTMSGNFLEFVIVTLTPNEFSPGTRYVSVYSWIAGVAAGIRTSMEHHIFKLGDTVTWHGHGSTAEGLTKKSR